MSDYDQYSAKMQKVVDALQREFLAILHEVARTVA